MAGKKGDKDPGDDMFGPEPWTLWFRRHTKLVLICIIILILGILLWYFFPHGYGDNSTNKAAQQTLETTLAAAEKNINNQEIVNITGQLIDGANNGTYHIDNETLAKYHMARATANINLKQLKTVAQDCEAAANMSDKYKMSAYYFEFQARYTLGERQQLIPVLNNLIQAEKSSPNPMRANAISQYQEYISDIQHNKEISI